METDIRLKKREVNFEILRILAAAMVLTYHVLNTCLNFDVLTNFEKVFAYNFLWAGGRAAVNIFIMISAWFLCDQNFKSKRILETWLTVWIYSVAVGCIFFIQGGGYSLSDTTTFPCFKFGCMVY